MSRIWLTGASSGIGAALASQLLEQGHRLALSARQVAPLQALATRYEDQVLVLPGDLTDPAQVADICRTIDARWGALDLVILNAGTCEYLEPGHFDTRLVERVLTTNLLGTSHCLEAALPLLRRGQRPHLVGMVGGPLAYCAGAPLAGVALPLGIVGTALVLAPLWALWLPLALRLADPH